MPKNLWPDFDVEKALPSPKAIIEEQGLGLKEKTNGLVQFYTMPPSMKDKGSLTFTFNLYTPALRYQFPFLRATFAIDKPYPVTIVADKVGEAVASDKDELIAILTKIFSAPSTVETIQTLMSLANQ